MSSLPQTEQPASIRQAFDETHFPVRYWADRWGFSVKTVRDWFRDEYGPGILRQPNTTIMISPSAAARVYGKRTAKELIH
jgi:predicted site-specific integrase-resolvase